MENQTKNALDFIMVDQHKPNINQTNYLTVVYSLQKN